MLTFSINEDFPVLDAAIRLIHTKVFDDKETAKHQLYWKEQEANAVECYNLTIDEDDDPCNINIPESEGHCEEILSRVEARSSIETGAMMCRRYVLCQRSLYVAQPKLLVVLKRKGVSNLKM